MNTDGAARFHAMYVAMCEACKRAGLPQPTPEQWVGLIENMIEYPLGPLDPPAT